VFYSIIKSSLLIMQRYYSYCKRKLIYKAVSIDVDQDSYDLDDFTMATSDSDYESESPIFGNARPLVNTPDVATKKVQTTLPQKLSSKLTSPELDKIASCESKKMADLATLPNQFSLRLAVGTVM
jgi:hypothetical protein